MQQLLANPAVQAAAVPFVVALVVAAILMRSRLAWLAVALGYAAMLHLSTGIGFTPLSASRKVVLLALLAPLLGLVLDYVLRSARPWMVAGLALLPAPALYWVFGPILERAGSEGLLTGAGLVVVAVLMAYQLLRMRDDGATSAASGLGLGLAAGIGALLSASTGYFMAGTAIAAGAGALAALQFATGRAIAPGFTGALTLGLAPALFGAATLVLAEYPPHAFALLLLVPWAAGLAPAGGSTRTRVAIASLLAVLAAALPLLAAWLATRQPM